MQKEFEINQLKKRKFSLFHRIYNLFYSLSSDSKNNHLEEKIIPPTILNETDKKINMLIESDLFLMVEEAKLNGYQLSVKQKEKLNSRLAKNLNDKGISFLMEIINDKISIEDELLIGFLFSYSANQLLPKIENKPKNISSNNQKQKDYEVVTLELATKRKMENYKKSPRRDDYFDYLFESAYEDDEDDNDEDEIYYSKYGNGQYHDEYLDSIDPNSIEHCNFQNGLILRYQNHSSSQRYFSKNYNKTFNTHEVKFVLSLLADKFKNPEFSQKILKVFSIHINKLKNDFEKYEQKNNYLDKAYFSKSWKTIFKYYDFNVVLEHNNIIKFMSHIILPNITQHLKFSDFLNILEDLKKTKISFDNIINKPEYKSKKILTKNEKEGIYSEANIDLFENRVKCMEILLKLELKESKTQFIQEITNKINKSEVINKDLNTKFKQLSSISQEAKDILAEITELLGKCDENKAYLQVNDLLILENIYTNNIPQIFERYFSIDEKYRNNLKHMNNKTATDLLVSSLKNLEHIVEEKYLIINHHKLSELSVSERVTTSMKKH